MTQLATYLEEILPEMKNVSRLFSLPESVWEGEPAPFAFEEKEEGGCYRCTCTLSGQSATLSVPVPGEEADPRLTDLHRKRAARRLCKQTAYELCRKVTGLHPAWGSMTGVRPTHLMYEALDQGLTPAEAAQQLQQTFDILPEKAALLQDIVTVQSRLTPPSDGDMDVYVGIPFCTTRCAYCSFSGGEIGNGRLVEPYLAALWQEMDACAALMRDAGKRLRAVYVGGGTPTSLYEEQFARLMDKLMTTFPGAEEYTVEAGRPDTVTRGKLACIRDHGVGRISINPQTMVDRTLEVIGRGHTARQIEEAYALARAVGIPHINMDVIAALPGEDLKDFAYTMEKAKTLHPESLTVHTLAIKRSSKMHLEHAPLPDGDTAAAMVHMGLETAKAMGMTPYYLYRQKYMAGNQENVGYALPGHACLYNVDIMEETTHILALGAGGISKRVYPEEGRIGRAPNVYNIEQYITRVEEMIQRKRDLFLGEEASHQA